MWEKIGRGASWCGALAFDVRAGEDYLEDLGPHAGCKALVKTGNFVGGDEMGGEEVGARNRVDGCGGVECGSDLGLELK